MAPQLTALALLIGGALIAVVVGGAMFFVGRASMTGASQVRSMNRELMAGRIGWQRQLSAIRDAVSTMKVSPETRPHVALYLEEYVEPLLVQRAAPDEVPQRPLVPRLGLFLWRLLVGRRAR